MVFLRARKFLAACLLVGIGMGLPTTAAWADDAVDLPQAGQADGCDMWLGDWAKKAKGPALFRIESRGGSYTVRSRSKDGQWMGPSAPMRAYAAHYADKELGLLGCVMEDKEVGTFMHGREPNEAGKRIVDSLWSGAFLSWKIEEIYRVGAPAKPP